MVQREHFILSSVQTARLYLCSISKPKKDADMNFWKKVLPIILGLIGLLLIIGVVLDWDWLCDPLYTRSMNSIFGRTGRRILFGLLGSIMVLVSVLRLKNKKK